MMPFLLAQAADTMSVELSATAIVTGVASIALGLGGWLLRRSVSGIDSKLSALDSKLDGLAKAQGDGQVLMAELRVKVSQLELDLRDLAKRHNDLSGWLSSKGFKTRGPDGGW